MHNLPNRAQSVRPLPALNFKTTTKQMFIYFIFVKKTDRGEVENTVPVLGIGEE